MREKGLMGGREKESLWLKEGTKTTQHNTTHSLDDLLLHLSTHIKYINKDSKWASSV